MRLIVALLVLTALLLQATLEFGPLWLVALTVSAGLYGPRGRADGRARAGRLARGRLVLSRPATVAVIAGTIVGSCVVLATSHAIGVVIAAQVLLVLVVVAVSIPVTAGARRHTVDDPPASHPVSAR